METRKAMVNAPSGLHARPVGELVKIVKGYADTVVTLSAGEKKVKASSMLSVLSLGLKQGTEVTIEAEGANAAAAADAVASFIASVSE